MTTSVVREPMWERLKWQRCLTTYSKTLGEDRLHPDAPFPNAATTPVSDTVVHPVPQVHNSDPIDISAPMESADPIRALNNFLRMVKKPANLVPLLHFESVQMGPDNQATHIGTYTCEPVSHHL